MRQAVDLRSSVWSKHSPASTSISASKAGLDSVPGAGRECLLQPAGPCLSSPGKLLQMERGKVTREGRDEISGRNMSQLCPRCGCPGLLGADPHRTCAHLEPVHLQEPVGQPRNCSPVTVITGPQKRLSVGEKQPLSTPGSGWLCADNREVGGEPASRPSPGSSVQGRGRPTRWLFSTVLVPSSGTISPRVTRGLRGSCFPLLTQLHPPVSSSSSVTFLPESRGHVQSPCCLHLVAWTHAPFCPVTPDPHTCFCFNSVHLLFPGFLLCAAFHR